MPIKGLTDTVAAFPQIGVLRKGDKKTEENKPGKDLTYFRFDSDDQQATSRFYDVYGSEPRCINVFLPFPTTDENGQFWLEEWKGGGLVRRGDDKNWILWLGTDGKYHTEPEPMTDRGNAKPTGRVFLVIPELQRLAYVVLVTTSWNDCRELSANIRAAELTAHQMGKDLRGIPFRLTRVEREISTPRPDGKRVRSKKWMCHLEIGPEWVQKQLTAARRMALSFEAPAESSGYSPQLPAPSETEPDDDDDVTEVIDHETGEIITVEKPKRRQRKPPEPPPVEAPKAEQEDEADGKAPKRPLPATVLIRMFADKIRELGGDVPPKKGELLTTIENRNLVLNKLAEAFAPGTPEVIDAKRAAFLQAVAGSSNPMQLTATAVQPIIKWLVVEQPDQGGHRPLRRYVAEEAEAIAATQMKLEKQQLHGLEG